jgi:hypothetical protein
MATYHYWTGGSNTAPYDTWAKAATTYATAIGAANADGDVILAHYASQENLAADTTFTYLADIHVISVDKDNSNALTPMGTSGWIGHNSANRGINLDGARSVYHYGITWRISGATGDSLSVARANGAHFVFEQNYVWIANSNATSVFSNGAQDGLTRSEFINCTFEWGAAGQGWWVRGDTKIVGGSISSSGTALTSLFFTVQTDPGGMTVEAEGFDISHNGSGAIIGNCTSGTLQVRMARCTLGSGFGLLAAQTHATGAGPELWLNDCASGDSHIHIAHANNLGSTVIDTGIYVTADAEELSWKVTSTANASYGMPYASPWVDKYNSDVATAITPRIEVLRQGDTNAYETDEIWGEFSYKGTSASTQSTIVRDRMAPLGSPAAQTTGMGIGSWTYTGSAWSGELEATASFTPAEIGYVRGRVCVGEPSTTVYVSPRVRL